jgi:hypothetical protein
MRPLVALFPAVLLVAAACGAPPSGALVGDGTVRHAPAGGEWAEVAPGRVPFGNSDTLEAFGGPARLLVACVLPLSGAATIDGEPAAGQAVVELSAGAQLRRRSGSMFELLSGTATVRTGPLKTRLVIFHGPAFVEVHEGHADNGAGVELRAIAGAETLRIDVVKGAAQLLTPVLTPKDLHEVKLAAGESAVAKRGAKPAKVE